MASVELTIATREQTGKGAARKLRAANRVPGVLYGHAEVAEGATAVSVDAVDLRRALNTRAGRRAVLNLRFDGTDRAAVAILKELQRDPVSQAMLHADFLAIDLNEPLEIEVPIHAVGTSVGVKNESGVLEWARRELTIRVLPTAIPDAVEVDISDLHVGQSLHVGDIKAEGFEIVDDPEQAVCAVASSRLTLEEEAPEGEEAVAEGAAAPAAKGDSSESNE